MHCSRCGSNIAFGAATCTSCGLHIRIQEVTPLNDEITKVAAREEDTEDELMDDDYDDDDEFLSEEPSRTVLWLRRILAVLCVLALVAIGVLIGKLLFEP